MVPNTRQNARPHSLIRWTLLMHTNKMFAWKVGYSVISLHSLLCSAQGPHRWPAIWDTLWFLLPNRSQLSVQHSVFLCSMRMQRHWVLKACEPRLKLMSRTRKITDKCTMLSASPFVGVITTLIGCFWVGSPATYASVVFASPVYRTGNIHRTELDWTTVQSFSSCSCPHLGSVQLPVAMFL